ncbi:3'-5' exonuclease [Corynebacterium lactis]|uniref:DNA polymerase III subunit epsilon n=1 Tax=Corynebacterium lactis RW2-5 TaxID=1408189 RepID=A0A0K2GZD4_9CORY|nr:3'-5' exonuclease [Corynebacterium lactis]ALA67149.1 DNA polymerase III subunit epsilon [Corynebacterium lactis RW2-5]
MFSSLTRLKTRRAAGPLRKLYDTPVRDNAWLAVDVETTGLDPARDRLLSIGWVAVEGHDIVLAESGYVVIRADGAHDSVGESATIHGLTDDMLATGVSAKVGVGKLLQALSGRALLAHYAQMEIGFLDPLCRKHFGAPLKVPVADTMAREYEKMLRADQEPKRDELRLWSLLERYGIPPMKAHHAFNDALACAQVWLAQQAV